MTKRDDRTGQGSELRRRAEEVVLENAARSPGKQAPLLPEEMREALHDLQVHQIELKMQNLELLRSHVELDAARARYLDLYDLAPVGYLTVSEKGGILEANLAAATLLGVDRRSLLRRQFFGFIHKDDRNTFYLYGKQLLESDSELREDPVEGGATLRQSSGGESAQLPGCELRIIKKDGTMFWAYLTATAAQGEDGTPEYRVVLTDITKRKEGDEEFLRENETRFDQLAEQSGTFIWEVDPQGFFTYVSRTSEAVIGYRPDELIGRPFYELHPESGREEFLKAAFSYIKRGAPFQNYRNSAVCKDGRLVMLSTNGLPLLDADGTVTSYRGSDTDITERERIQNQLYHSQKVDSVGQLACGLVHDFNNILSIINGYCTFMLTGREDRDPQDIEYLERIQQTLDRAAELTRGMLAFSRTQLMNLKNQDLNLILSNVGRFAKKIIGDDILFRLALFDDHIPVHADSGQIEQVLINLIINARDAMPNGGELTIATNFLEMDLPFIATHGFGTPGAYAVITVSDTGTGMDEATCDKIFEPYFTTKGAGKGAGLGLAMVKGIVKQHNGFVDVSSELGQGTIFLVYLPVLEVTDAGEEKKTFSAAETLVGSETILVAEDDGDLREILGKLLTNSGYQVLLAVDGQDAVEQYREVGDKIALVIMDMVMPRKSGKEAYEALRKLRPGPKVLFTSGYRSGIKQQLLEVDEYTEFIPKPLRPAELLKKVREMLER